MNKHQPFKKVEKNTMGERKMKISARQANQEPICLANIHQHWSPTAHDSITRLHGKYHDEKSRSHSTKECFDFGSDKKYIEKRHYGITGRSLEESSCGSYDGSLEELQNGSKFEFTGQKRQNYSCVSCSSVDKVTRGEQKPHIHKVGMDEIMQQQPGLLKSAGFCTLQRNKAGSKDYRKQGYTSEEAFKKTCLTMLPPLEPTFHPFQLTNAFGNFGSFTTKVQPVVSSAEELMQASFPVSSYMDQVASFPEELQQESSYDTFFTPQTHQWNFSTEESMQLNLMLCNDSNAAQIDSMGVSELHAKNIIPQEDAGLENNLPTERSENTEHYKNECSLVSSLGNNNMANESFRDFEGLKFQEQITCLSHEEDTGNMQSKNYSKILTGKRKSAQSTCDPGKSKYTVKRKVLRPVCATPNKTPEKCAVREKNRCSNSGCLKFAQAGGKCVAHGGGKRCLEADCNKYALLGGKCYAHGVRKICTVIDCTKYAMPRGKFFVHGDGKSLDKVTGGAQQSHVHKIGVNEVIQQQHKLLNSDGFCTLQRNKVGVEDYREHAYISKEAFTKPCLTQLPPFEPHFVPSELTNAIENPPFCFPISSFTAQAQPAAFSAEELMRASFPVSSYMDQLTSSTKEVKRKGLYNTSSTLPTNQREFSAEQLMWINLMLCNNNNAANIGNMTASELHAKNTIQEDESLENNSSDCSLVSNLGNKDYMANESFSDLSLKFPEQIKCSTGKRKSSLYCSLVSSLGNKDNMTNESFSDLWLKFPEQIKCSAGKRKPSLSKCTPRKSKFTLDRKVLRPGCNKQNKTQEKHAVRDKKRCSEEDCLKFAQTGGKCVAHGGGKRCLEEDCNKYALSGGKCYAHGVRKICAVTDCTKSAMPGGKCFVHGGGKRCSAEGCKKYAKIGGKCVAHGGGRRCLEKGCIKSAQAGGRCVNHGGGRRCSAVGCKKSAKTGGRCIAHGGGKRCLTTGCTKSVQVGGKCIAHSDNIDAPICAVPSVSSLADISWWL